MILARYLSLGAPALAVLAAGRLDRRAIPGAALAFAWAMTGIAALHEPATRCTWYSFAPVDGAYRGMPVDLWLGWALLWGPLPVLLRRRVPLIVPLGLLLWTDAIAMPALHSLVRLGPHWLIGELLGLTVVALPAQLLGRWTADRRRLRERALLQVVLFAGLSLWLLPSIAFTLGDGGWDRLTALRPSTLFLLAQAALLLATPAVAAVREFVVRGGGTPFPWDPPVRLVTSGPYAYVANPMQVSAILLVLLLAAVTTSRTLAAGALLAVAFAAAVAAPHETTDLSLRYGASWRTYRRHVRDWIPRPHPLPTGDELWLDEDCGPCSVLSRFFRRRGLPVRAAADSPVLLWRARYREDDGVRAVARALEQAGLGWAYAGWVLQLPLLDRLAQIVVDALIAPPHPAGPPAGGHAGAAQG
ncbi:methyltransferase [Actinoplanes sp. N902-109]|uniref:methyltransferase n=1 Tax=Actinoplanes sp. (strain N902-109) TaxID=649831 RepID=UPI0003294563|nr:methyltransferase [Actinoplanes sp. N902-109]AGL17408.1 hypothetical protein L083_3898 [Actinoplanes sp. N902-109]